MMMQNGSNHDIQRQNNNNNNGQHYFPASNYNNSPEFMMPNQTTINEGQKRGRDGEDIGRSSQQQQQQQQQRHEVQHMGSPPSALRLQQHQSAQQPGEVAVSTSSTSSSGVEQDRSGKRSRSNTYQAPRSVKPSILTALGSLAGGSQQQHQHQQQGGNSNNNVTSVPLRRRLSGGNLEEFIGGHDNMDMDMSDSRPRSMSF